VRASIRGRPGGIADSAGSPERGLRRVWLVEVFLNADAANRETLSWISLEILPHEAEVRRWLRRAAPDDLDVNDVVQEAYSRIARRPDGGPINSGRAYFFTVARNIVREHFRRSRVVRIEPLAEIDQLSIYQEPSAERVLAAREELRLVWRLMDQLPDRCRRVFLLRKIDGLSQKEIARAMGVSENVVEKQIALGLRLLLKLLSEHTGGEEVAPAQRPTERHERKAQG
jgi:RNA polymerase sigma-70 factor (ECF subfamily)